uniref:Uncharacterized protein n=1 Tax=Astyanax mexicanus TaxID=7994 RepID=A0A8B9LVK4_ASTMX
MLSPENVPHQEKEGVFSRCAEVFTSQCYHDVGVSVEESDTFLQTPKAALQTAQEEPAKTVFNRTLLTFQLLGADGERRDIIRFFQSPVVGGEGTGQGHLTKCSYEVHTPEEQEQVIELKNDKVLVVVSFSTVERKQTLGIRALHRLIGGGQEAGAGS